MRILHADTIIFRDQKLGSHRGNQMRGDDDRVQQKITQHDDVINGNIFRVTGPLSVTGEFPSQRPITRSFDVSLICTLNKRLSKQ